MKKSKFNNRGITLVALVITIIVLLILAGVSISLTIGENGILTKAKDSKERYEEAREYERVQLVIADAQMRSNSKKITYKNLKDAADNEFGENQYKLKYDLSEKNFKLTVNESGKTYDIPADSSDVANELKEIAMENNSTITEESMRNAADEIFGEGNYNLIHDGDKFEIIPNTGDGEEKIIINEDGSDIEVKVRNIVTLEMIRNNPSTYYGKNVNYTATVKNQDTNSNQNVTGWKVFHADDSNIYLIAENYINANLCPPSSKDTVSRPNYVAGGNNPRLNFDNYNLIQSYAGTTDIPNQVRKWLSRYFEKNFSSSWYNMRIIAYLLDTTAWAGYANSDVADYAIGAPTLEMVAASYNSLYPNTIKIETYTDSTQVEGYRLDITRGSMDQYDHGLNNSISLYAPATDISLWLATPPFAAGNNLNVLYPVNGTYGDGGIGNDNATGSTTGITASPDNALRPVVCLKNTVKLELSSDNTTYNIVND